MTDTRWRARAEAWEEKCNHIPYKWGLCVACVATFAAEVAREALSLPPCPDCFVTQKIGTSYVPCVRHGGAEHGFDPGPLFIGWDDTWEHWKRRALIAEAAARDELERVLEILAPMRLRFTSGNEIPVERAYMRREEWEALKALLW